MDFIRRVLTGIKDFFVRIARGVRKFVVNIFSSSPEDELDDDVIVYNHETVEAAEMTEDKKTDKRKLFEITKNGSMFADGSKPRLLPLSILFTTLKVLLVLGVLIGVGSVGLVLGVAKAYIDTTPMLDIAALTDSSMTSYIYDADGNVITTFAGLEYREWADIEEIPDMLVNAVIAIEDVRFEKHEGVDYKRLVSAIINTFRNEDTHGGSTITQQLIKNTILTNVQSYKRKIQEAYLALQLESVSDKDSILEAYLNLIFFGDQNYGVKAAASDYFGKELGDLTIRECAMLAGMIQKPNGYNPRLNMYTRIDSVTGENYMWRTDNRTNTVINSMYDAGFITLAQKDAALYDTVNIVEHSDKSGMYEMAYFVEYAVYDVVTQLIEQRGLVDTTATRNMIETELRTSGYHIYLTVDSEIQKTVEYQVEHYNNYPKLRNSSASVREDVLDDGTVITTIEPQAAAAVIDHTTGNLVAIVGGRTQPTQKKSWNRAYMSALEVGSSIKPIAVYGPALDLGISPASVAYNIPGSIEGWNTDSGYPSLGNSAINVVSIRRGVRSSLNVVAARTLMDFVTIEKSKEYLMKLGIPEKNINADGPGLALGTTGITPIQMAAAYATIANGGMYNEPLSFTKVVDSDGMVILDAAQVRDTHRVYKESSAYLLLSMMEDVVSSGTGTNARLSGMTVAGKTGTNSDYSSVCFSGVTPYYAATVWIGHDYPENLLAGSATGGTYAAPLWKNFMSIIHEGLEDKEIMDDVTTDSLGLVRRTVCSVSGLLATDACYADETHSPITDWFYEKNVPEKHCDVHKSLKICTESGLIATAGCPTTETRSIVLIRTRSTLARFARRYLDEIFPNAMYTSESFEDFTGKDCTCTTHSGGGHEPVTEEETVVTTINVDELIEEAESMISTVEGYLSGEHTLTEEEEQSLTEAIKALKLAISYREPTYIQTYMDKLSSLYKECTGLEFDRAGANNLER